MYSFLFGERGFLIIYCLIQFRPKDSTVLTHKRISGVKTYKNFAHFMNDEWFSLTSAECLLFSGESTLVRVTLRSFSSLLHPSHHHTVSRYILFSM